MTQRTLIVFFGGMDVDLIREYDLKNVTQPEGEFGTYDISATETTEPDEIIASLITGELPPVHDIRGSMHYTNEIVHELEQILPDHLDMVRRQLYAHLRNLFDGFDCRRRRYVASDISTETIFDEVENSKPLFIPSYNPEIQWCILRNTIRVSERPDLGLEGAQELIDKNHYWRQKVLSEEISKGHDLLAIHFQCIDSVQHVYYQDLGKMDPVRQEYQRMDELAGELKAEALEAGFENVLYLSEHGKPNLDDDPDYHRRRPFYSYNGQFETDELTVTDFYREIIKKMNL